MHAHWLTSAGSVAVMLLLCLSGAAPQACAGTPAPPFDLELISGDGYLSSDELFSSYPRTYLLFWDSGCPHCVSVLTACEQFYQEQFGETVTVVGIHTGDDDLFAVRSLLERNHITFFQLHDRGGATARAYAVTPSKPALFLIDDNGVIRYRIDDPAADIAADMLVRLSDAAGGIPESEEAGSDRAGTTAAPASPDPEWVFRGHERIRFLGIDSRGEAAAGPYGETVSPGNNLHYRFELEISRRSNRHFSAGALLQIGNEGTEVLETGPRYLGSEWGSAFAQLQGGGASFRLGYYEIAMTPLTLMRWDWDDNPRTGGDAGCGCGAAVAVLLMESLEELSPELLFEGALAAYDRGHFRTRLFYALPRRARETRYVTGPAGEENRARYSLELAGFETLFRRFSERTQSFWRAGIHATGTWENRRSVDFIRLNYPLPDPWRRSIIVSASVEIPLFRNVAATGEWILWNHTEIDSLTRIYHDMFTFEWRSGGTAFDGEGGIAGLSFTRSKRLYAKCDYLRLDGGFYSPFAALSYTPQREGIRLSGRAPLPGTASAVSLFYKRLRELDRTAGFEREQESFFGASLDADFKNGAGGSIGWLDRGEWREGVAAPYDESRRALVVTGRYRISTTTLLQLQFQRVVTEESREGQENESLASLYTVYLSSRF